MNFETSLATLENIIKKMEAGKLSLEESLTEFETGVKLAKECQQALTAAEQRVQILVEQQGEFVTTPFVVEEAEA